MNLDAHGIADVAKALVENDGHSGATVKGNAGTFEVAPKRIAISVCEGGTDEVCDGAGMPGVAAAEVADRSCARRKSRTESSRWTWCVWRCSG